MNRTATVRAVVLAVAVSGMAYAISVPAQPQRGVAPSAEEAANVLANARPMAEQGNANAQYNMGVLYDEGYGVERNYETARGWYEKAAAQGYAKAEHNLGILYQEGHGVPADDAKAADWFRQAAEHGEPAAQNNLAVMYVRGQGVQQDMAEAAMWAARAAKAGNDSAIANLPAITANMSQSRIDGDSVNIRAEPTTNGQVLLQAGRNTQVVVLGTRNDWVQVLFPEQYTVGWVADFLLADSGGDSAQSSGNDAGSTAQTSSSSQAQSDASSQRRIAGSGVNIRARPTTGAEVLFQASEGDQVSVLASENDWREVRFDDGRTGWVAGFLLGE